MILSSVYHASRSVRPLFLVKAKSVLKLSLQANRLAPQMEPYRQGPAQLQHDHLTVMSHSGLHCSLLTQLANQPGFGWNSCGIFFFCRSHSKASTSRISHSEVQAGAGCIGKRTQLRQWNRWKLTHLNPHSFHSKTSSNSHLIWLNGPSGAHGQVVSHLDRNCNGSQNEQAADADCWSSTQ